MPLTFTQVPLVSKGDKITSGQHNKLAKAINDRLLSGVADGAWRIVWDVLALAAQIRSRDEAGNLFAPAEEWLRIYGLIEPGEVDWESGIPPAGEAEGLNIQNPLVNFVFGVDLGDNTGMDNESDRLAGVPPASGSPLEIWETAKLQRGAIEPGPDMRGIGAPALAAARAHQDVAYDVVSRYAKLYGSFHPSREFSGEYCGDDFTDPTPIQKIFFTPLAPFRDTLPVKNYLGFCPGASPGAAGTIAWIGYGRDYYTIYEWATTTTVQVLERLRTDQYQEGPYTGGGILTRFDGDQIEQALHAFNASFRGSEAERVEPFRVRELGFDFQAFFRDQYFLAPQFGHVDGDAVVPDYATYTLTGEATYPAGTLFAIGGGSYDIHADFVLAGFIVVGDGLQAMVQVELFDAAGWVRRVSLKPDGDGHAEVVLMLSGDEIKRRAALQMRLVGDVTLDDGGGFQAELAELLAYKPSVPDAYVVLRIGSAGASTGNPVDGFGRYSSGVAKALSDGYFNYGAIINGAGGPGDQTKIAENPVYEAARLMMIENVRMAGRTWNGLSSIKGYEVIVEEGVEKSVVYFDRYIAFQNSHLIDIFRNIAPPIEPVSPGEIKAGYEYVARGGSVDYNGETYAENARFIGKHGHADFTPAGGAQVFVYEGIRGTAAEKQMSNRWCAFFSENVYKDLETGTPNEVFKRESYDSSVSLQNRCQFYATDWRYLPNRPLRSHALPPGDTIGLYPQSPTGYTYARWFNDPAGHGISTRSFTEAHKEAFYRSCRIYEPPNEIESCTYDSTLSRVRVKFKRRIRHCHTVSGIMNLNRATWDIPRLNAEPYRTDENAIRQFLVYMDTLGTGPENVKHCPRGVIGDTGIDTSLWTEDIAPFGSCFTRAWFVRLAPEVYEDNNDRAEPAVDVRCLIDTFQMAEKYGRAMCEGYIDGRSTELANCSFDEATTGMYDYSVENWYFDAIGSKFLPVLPFAVRGDLERTFGPYATQTMYAEIYNSYANAFNLLTRARIELPMSLQCRVKQYRDFLPITPDWPGDATCVGSGDMKAIGLNRQPIAATTLISDMGWPADDLEDKSAWDCADDIVARHFSELSEDCTEGGGFQILSARTAIDYRVKFSDDLAIHAVPEDLRALLLTEGTGFLAFQRSSVLTPRATVVGTSEESQGCCAPEVDPCNGLFWDPGLVQGWSFGQLNEPDVITCVLAGGGSIDVDPAPRGDFYMARDGANACRNSSERLLQLTRAGDNLQGFVQVPLV